jgi:RimJ/RimL family protein N-acetyltransferase
MEIKTNRLTLKEVDLKDIENIHKLHCFPEVDEFNTLGIPENIDVSKALVKKILKDQKTKPRKNYEWKIIIKQTNEFIGMAGIFLSLDKFRLGEIYYKLLPAFWGKGFATEVAKNLVLAGFNEFNLHKVEAGVATENVRSIKVLEKAGMTREGLRRKVLPVRGKWIDNFHYAIVEDDPRDY